ncbi:PREDICTED: rho GDP-dissociation inhibitor 1-like [Camelina sativa]|uniref:Rho GDP-dissociation inhibitor 1-like n=1 Tax=Camelina sativa TaxID=90675 RepID=A0ABM0Y0M7_CAMSA|nr:PREDICTED: rho GDP-dissociation inhibitor 1-like [Camelina sativa]
MGLKDEENKAEGSSEEPKGQGLSRKNSHSSICPTDDDDEEEEEDKKLDLGPMIALKEQLEKDKDDESLRRWKEQLLGSVDLEEVGETPDPVVKILTLTLRSPEREDMVLTIPENGKPTSKGPWFTLKEGAKYSLVFTFRVTNNIVSGLRYSNTIWKTGIKVYSRKEMLGTFSPQAEPYNHVMFEETAPSGLLVRGSYSVKSKFVDDDNKCYLENNYNFDIRKNWV